MSAPDTNLERQKKNHAGPLIGIGAVVAFVGIILFVYMTNIAGGPAEGEADVVNSSSVTAPASE